MKNTSAAVPYSILELATVSEGSSINETFIKTLELAQHAEQFGYRRFWLSEHHNMENVASSATAVLIGYVAAGTKTMRIGSGGIMLPNHSPLAVAEQFGTLESLYPGRIDLGLGRAPGTDQMTALALRGDFFNNVNEFPENILKVQKYFSAENRHSKVRAIPGEGLDIPIWILGSSTDSARLAAALGLPYSFASHFAPAQFFNAIELYRKNFNPSEYLDKPYIMPCVNVIVANTDEEANRLATSLYQMFLGIVTGIRKPLQPPVDTMEGIWTEEQQFALKQMLSLAFIGSKEKVQNQVKDFLEKTSADEMMVISTLFDQKAKIESYRLFSEIMKSL